MIMTTYIEYARIFEFWTKFDVRVEYIKTWRVTCLKTFSPDTYFL